MTQQLTELIKCNNLDEIGKHITHVFNLRHIQSSFRHYILEIGDKSYFLKIGFYPTVAENVNLETLLKQFNGKVPKRLEWILTAAKAPKKMHPVDAEIAILDEFREKILARGYTPGIPDIHIVKRCPKPTGLACDPADNKFYSGLCWTSLLADAGYYDSDKGIVYVVMENMSMDLGEFIMNYRGVIRNVPAMDRIFQSLVFQAMYVMYVIQALYPNFKHGDLYAFNYMLQIDNNASPHSINGTQYILFDDVVGGRKFYVPYYGIIVKLIDYEFSNCQPKIINQTLGTMNFRVGLSDEAYLTMQLLMMTQTLPSLKEIYERVGITPEMIDLTLQHNNSKIDDFPTFAQILNGFDEFLKPRPREVVTREYVFDAK